MKPRLPDPAVMARIKNLELLSRRLVDGYLSGVHVSTSRGSSYNFAEHRTYVPGDDVRRIDWRLFARKKQLYVKTFDAESSAQLTVVLDCSASMGYSSGGVSKFDFARIAAACLLRLAHTQGDRVGLALLGHATEREQTGARSRAQTTSDASAQAAILPRAGGYGAVMHRLQGARVEAGRSIEQPLPNPPSPAASIDFDSSLSAIAQSLRRKGMVMVLSDFYAEPETIARGMQALRMQGQDPTAFHICDPRENDFEVGDQALLEDMETGERRAALVAEAAPAYLNAWSAHRRAMEEKLTSRDIMFTSFTTDQPLERLLFSYLSERGRYRRIASR